MVTEVLNSPKSFLHMTKLPHPDRAYLVAGLTVRGMVAEEIADRTHCSLRLIRTIRSWEMTAVCKWVHHQTTVLERDLSTERAAHAHTRRALADSSRDNERLRNQLAQILDKLQAGTLKAFPRCGHPRVGYNVYRRNGQERCRECRRTWDAKKRKPRPLNSQSVPVNGNPLPATVLSSAS
ncbi:hypothetical protein B1R94_02275 [Mycolicibacterium litorale]|nr:hypothetical protein B1R94_02275 [Mycolicibacterium litorale]